MILLNDKPLEEYGLYLLKGHSHPSPSITNKTIKIPGRAGQYHFGNEVGARPFNHPVAILQDNPTLTQNRIRKFTELLFDEYGQTKEIKLQYSYEADKHYTVVFDGSIDPNRIHEYAEFRLPFIANDPYAYSEIFADEIQWGSKTLTFESNYLLGHEGTDGLVEVTSPTTLNVFVDGYAVKPIIEINGSSDSLTVSNNGQSFSMESFTNASWIIDCDKYTVLKNGEGSFGEVKLRDFWLNKGANNVEINGTNINISIRIKFRDRYM